MSSRLPEAEQRSLLQQMDEDEFKTYFGKASVRPSAMRRLDRYLQGLFDQLAVVIPMRAILAD